MRTSAARSGSSATYPLDQVGRTLVFYSGSEPIIHGKSRVAGLTLKATDTDLTIGTGPLVEGPVMDLLIATSGRKSVLDKLSGAASNTPRPIAIRQNETGASTSSTITPSGSVTVAAKPLRAGIVRGVPPSPSSASRASVASTGDVERDQGQAAVRQAVAGRLAALPLRRTGRAARAGSRPASPGSPRNSVRTFSVVTPRKSSMSIVERHVEDDLEPDAVDVEPQRRVEVGRAQPDVVHRATQLDQRSMRMSPSGVA